MSVDSIARGLAAKASTLVLSKIARSPAAFSNYSYSTNLDAPPYSTNPITATSTLSGLNFGSIVLNPTAVNQTITLPAAVTDGGSTSSTLSTSGIWVEFWNISGYMITISCATGQVFHNSNAQSYQLATHMVMKISLLQANSSTPLILATVLPIV